MDIIPIEFVYIDKSQRAHFAQGIPLAGHIEVNRMEEGKLARLKNLVQMSGLSMRRPFQSSYSQQPRLSSSLN